MNKLQQAYDLALATVQGSEGQNRINAYSVLTGVAATASALNATLSENTIQPVSPQEGFPQLLTNWSDVMDQVVLPADNQIALFKGAAAEFEIQKAKTYMEATNNA